MTPISHVLQPDHVNLALSANSRTEAVEAVLSKLNGDPRVTNFAQLEAAVKARNAPAISENGWGICLAHGRTDSVTELVMAAGRVTPGFTCRDVKDPVRLIFVAGIPSAFDSEYLRIVGAIARICRDRHQFERLLAAKTPEDFIHLLGAAEVKL